VQEYIPAGKRNVGRQGKDRRAITHEDKTSLDDLYPLGNDNDKKKKTTVRCIPLKICSAERDQVFFLNQVCTGRNQSDFLEKNLKMALHYDT